MKLPPIKWNRVIGSTVLATILFIVLYFLYQPLNWRQGSLGLPSVGSMSSEGAVGQANPDGYEYDVSCTEAPLNGTVVKDGKLHPVNANLMFKHHSPPMLNLPSCDSGKYPCGDTAKDAKPETPHFDGKLPEWTFIPVKAGVYTTHDKYCLDQEAIATATLCDSDKSVDECFLEGKLSLDGTTFTVQ